MVSLIHLAGKFFSGSSSHTVISVVAANSEDPFTVVVKKIDPPGGRNVDQTVKIFLGM